jgi:hypothetical protein
MLALNLILEKYIMEHMILDNDSVRNNIKPLM